MKFASRWIVLCSLACSETSPPPVLGDDTIDSTQTPAIDSTAEPTSDTATTTPAPTDTSSRLSDTMATDTATSTQWGGTYTGPIAGSVSGQRSMMGPVTSFSCAGLVEWVIDELASPQIAGSGDCTDGAESWTVDVTGSIHSGNQADGTMEFAHASYPFHALWRGELVGNTLAGVTEGTTAGYPIVTWNLLFSASR